MGNIAHPTCRLRHKDARPPAAAPAPLRDAPPHREAPAPPPLRWARSAWPPPFGPRGRAGHHLDQRRGHGPQRRHHGAVDQPGNAGQRQRLLRLGRWRVGHPQQHAPLRQALQHRLHPLHPQRLQLLDHRRQPVGALGRKHLDQVAGEVDLGEVHLAVHRPQKRRRRDEPVIAARMHRVEPVRHVLRPGHLHNRQMRLARHVQRGAVGQIDVGAGVLAAQVRDRDAQVLFHQRREGRDDEAAIGLGPAQRDQVFARQIAPWSPERQPRRPVMTWKIVERPIARMNKSHHSHPFSPTPGNQSAGQGFPKD